MIKIIYQNTIREQGESGFRNTRGMNILNHTKRYYSREELSTHLGICGKLINKGGIWHEDEKAN
ncbi:MAG: hypothetical protein ACK4TF_02830 [Thermodesulfovibrionales bacterium]